MCVTTLSVELATFLNVRYTNSHTMETEQFTEGQENNHSVEKMNGKTPISFVLKNPSDVVIEIYDLQGEKCATVSGKNLMEGEQQIVVSTSSLGIEPGNYVYHLQVTDRIGTSTECRTIWVE